MNKFEVSWIKWLWPFVYLSVVFAIVWASLHVPPSERAGWMKNFWEIIKLESIHRTVHEFRIQFCFHGWRSFCQFYRKIPGIAFAMKLTAKMGKKIIIIKNTKRIAIECVRKYINDKKKTKMKNAIHMKKKEAE